ncbi:MAG: hypothetical protein JW966_14380 [Anaerolineae bacterium]|nr:hypothetical protein [Anaerolineae bacterium]
MSDLIRVSCASLCRIEQDGCLFLLLNTNRRRKGIYTLSPLGGALTLDDPSQLDAFGATPEDPASHDLRFTLSRVSLPAFSAWFYNAAGRERSPFRELQEELVSESGLLDALSPADVTWRYLWTVEEETFTARQGQTGWLTHYFLEIYACTFTNPAVVNALRSVPPASGAAWVAADVVRGRGTLVMDIDGARRDVRVNGYLLLEPPAKT